MLPLKHDTHFFAPSAVGLSEWRIGFYLWRITSAKGKSLFSLTQPILPRDGEMGGFWGVGERGGGRGWGWVLGNSRLLGV